MGRAGFTLVDLIVTTMLLVTLAGVGGFYYGEFRNQQKTSIASNELDTLTKAVQAYELTTSTAIDEQFVQSYTQRGFPPLQFLVEAGTLPNIPRDPWGNDYQIDTDKGVVFTFGPEGPDIDPDGADDLRKPYKKELGFAGAGRRLADPTRNPCDDDKAAPIIATVEPTGIIDKANVPVRATFFDNPGGSISLDRPPRLFIDGEEVTGSGLNRSTNQIVYTTPGGYSEIEHTVVAQVEDGCNNTAFRQWKFTVDVSSLNIEFVDLPAQVKGTFDIKAKIYNQGRQIDQWSAIWDSQVIATGKTFSNTQDEVITIFKNFDTIARGITDGNHTLRLSVKKTTGHTDEKRSTVNVDNTPPRIVSIFNKSTPGLTCLDAQRITTVAPDLGCLATDNFRVANVSFQYFNVDQGSGAIGAARNQPTTALPPDWDPDNNPQQQQGNPGALFNSASELGYTIPHGSASEYVPVTLPEGLYSLRFQATDLAGNESVLDTRSSTCFYVDLQRGGIRNARFFDGTPARCGMSSSEDQRHIRGALAIGAASSQETSGRIEFTILDKGVESCPICTWEVVIDDNGPGGRPDGLFTRSAPLKDWVTSGSFENKPAGSVYTSNLYVPDAPFESQRRSPGGTSTLNVAEGSLRARISYVSPTGTPYTTFTTFFVDNSVATGVGSAAFSVKQAGNVVPLQDKDEQGRDTVLFSTSSATDPTLGQIEFGGIFTDNPLSGVIRQVSWSLTKGPINQQQILVNKASVFPFAGSACTTHTASFGVVAGLLPGNAQAMVLSTSTIGGLDGEYRLTLSITDGAGLTTQPLRHFFVDTLPPEVQSIQIFRPGGVPEGVLAEVTCAQGPSTLTTIEGPTLRWRPIVQDQFPVREIHYWLVPITTPPTVRSAAIVLTVTSPAVNPSLPEIVVTRDTRNAPLKPLPQVYELQVEAVGVNRANPGPLCRTNVSFKFLSNMAIFAPFDALSSRVQALDGATISSQRTWISSQEQADAATYLRNAFGESSVQIFDFSGRNGRAGFDPILTVDSWLSQNASNGSTDIFVIFDSVPTAAVTAGAGATVPLKLFLEGGTATRPDGNIVVYVGPAPFARQIGGEPPAIAAGPSQASIFGGTGLGIDESSSNAVQVHNPAGRPSPFLPSLYEYSPFTDFFGSAGTVPNRWLRSGNVSAGSWVLDQLFTVESGQSRGNNFAYRNTSSQGIFASFYGMGESSQASDRLPVPPMPYVIEEFLRGYVVGDRNPVLSSKRIAFSNTDTTFSAALLTPSGAVHPSDVLAYPSSSGAYLDLTLNNSGNASERVLDISDDGRVIALLSDARTGSPEASFAVPSASLFAVDDGRMRLLAAARTGTAPILDGALARNGNAAAVVTRSDLAGINTGIDLTRSTIFRIDAATTARTQLTSGGAAFGDSSDIAISPEGNVIVFASANIYDAVEGSFPAAFLNPRTLGGGAGRGIFRYNGAASGSETYRDGWVTKRRDESTLLNADAVFSAPKISSGGTFVVFQGSNVNYGGTSIAQNQIFMAVAQSGGATPWRVGAITQAPGIACENPDMAEGPVGSASFPPVVFESRGDFSGRKPNADGIIDVSQSQGANAGSDLGVRCIYYFAGDYALDLIQIARGNDADCRNPRISPDGTEVVFESRATQVLAPVSVGPSPLLTHSVKNTSQKNRIYRAKVRVTQTIGGSPSAIVERITPESVDVGVEGNPVVSR